MADPAISIVVIATHDADHAEQVLAALRAGKHVFVEKPICTTADELRAIQVALDSDPSLVLSSNLVLRKEPRFLELKRRIDAGELGTPYLLEGSYDFGRFEQLTSGWRGRFPSYSVMHGGGIHLIDLLLWLKGSPVAEVFAYASDVASRGSAFKGNDLVCATLTFQDGSLGRVTANFASVAPHHHRLAVFGTQGTFVQDHLGAGYIRSRDSKTAVIGDVHGYPIAEKSAHVADFLGTVMDGTANPVPAEEVLRAMAVSVAIEQSVVQGRRVETTEVFS
jgi:predicted dehydrogenase